MSVWVAAAVSVWVDPAMPVPEVTVVMVSAAKPLVPVKSKAPTSPFDTLVSFTVVTAVLVKVQAMVEPAAVAAALSLSLPVVAVFLGAMFLGERVTSGLIAGGALILVAVLFTTTNRRKPAVTPVVAPTTATEQAG